MNNNCLFKLIYTVDIAMGVCFYYYAGKSGQKGDLISNNV